MKKIFLLNLLLAFLLSMPAYGVEEMNNTHDTHIKEKAKLLKITSKEKFSQFETGGPFAGVEVHYPHMFPGRISLYYPVANSIDHGGDYWSRNQAAVFSAEVSVDGQPFSPIEGPPLTYTVTPWSLAFSREEKDYEINISYNFLKEKPGFAITVRLTNNCKTRKEFRILTGMDASLRTSSSYIHKDKAWNEYIQQYSALYTNFEDTETGNACIFTLNAGAEPVHFSGRARDYDEKSHIKLDNHLISRENPEKPAHIFLYKKDLAPGESLEIIQLIGSCDQKEKASIPADIYNNYKTEIEKYETYIKAKAFEGVFVTNDPWLDRSVYWAKAIIAANVHYIQGNLLPMPCPAQYNFFFTHDSHLTNLGVVNYDIHRVSGDMDFIHSNHNEENVIPHARYWKDDRFFTEYAGADNWNHLWFVILSARYLRHSGDREKVREFVPRIEKSLKMVLTHKKDDDLIWGYRPDWWDIGNSYGPRTYMTALTVRALREYAYLACRLELDPCKALEYMETARRMETALNEKLWDPDVGFLINYNENLEKDSHLYIGSLPASHLGVLRRDRARIQARTAREKLLDERVGIYNAYPMDFHRLGDYFKFSGNEAGEPFFYMNGGVWSHGNAWYALALKDAGETTEATDFVKNIMTIDGIINSPLGQPAMYEYRCADRESPKDYGKIDKPQFLWAAGWYVYCCYHVLAIDETPWNIRFDPYLYGDKGEMEFSLYADGKELAVSVKGKGSYISSVKYDGLPCASAVIPLISKDCGRVEIEMGTPVSPLIQRTDSILYGAEWDEDKRILMAQMKSLKGMNTKTQVLSPLAPEKILIDGTITRNFRVISNDNELFTIEIDYLSKGENAMEIRF